MEKILKIIILWIVVESCGRKANVPQNIVFQQLKLSKNIYDSIQTFVATNTNSRSEIYLLEFLGRRFDSMDYRLTEIHPKMVSEKYKRSLYFYNIDSSILIIDDYYASLYANYYSDNYLYKNKKIKFSADTNSVIFNPLIWKLTVFDDQVFIDRYYGLQEAEKTIKIPKQKFIP